VKDLSNLSVIKQTSLHASDCGNEDSSSLQLPPQTMHNSSTLIDELFKVPVKKDGGHGMCTGNSVSGESLQYRRTAKVSIAPLLLI
jgi:hypothetical protein